MMELINAYPPMIDEIRAAFPIRSGVVFSWGDKVYCPGSGALHPAIMAHERIHGARQGVLEDGIRRWWRRYIDDPAFRLDEEIAGHQAEFNWYLDRHGDSRPNRRRYLSIIANKLAAPLYGGLVSTSEAKRILSDGRARTPSCL